MATRARSLVALAAMSLSLAAAAPAQAGEVAYAISGTSLASEDISTGTTLAPYFPITSLPGGDTPISIDVRPSTGQLYLLTLNTSTNPDALRLWTVDPTTRNASPVGSPQPTYALADGISDASIEFNPVTDTIRLVTSQNHNLRLNPVSGAPTPDTPLAYAPGDPGFGIVPVPHANAHSNNFPGARSTTLYVLDANASPTRLARQGSVGGSPISPNTGQLFLVGSGPPNVGSGGFALDASNLGTLYAGANRVFGLFFVGDYFRVSPGSPPVKLGSGGFKTDFALTRSSRIGVTASAVRAAEGGSVNVVVSRVGPADGPATVRYATADGSATSGSDYSPRSGTLTFAAGQSRRTISIPLTGDSADEGREVLTLALGNVAGSARGGVLPGRLLSTVVIDDDDQDRAGPRVALARVPRRITRPRFLRGFTIRVRPSEAASLGVALQATPRRARISRNELTLFSRKLGRAKGTRRVRIRPKRRLVRRLRRTIRVRLRIEATDALGNATVVTRTIRVKPDKKKKRRR